MRDLLTRPLCHAEDLGSAIPPHAFGVSVCLPQWRHVIGYEEKDPAVVAKFQSGYPRFCCPPAISDLFAAAEREFASEGERCLVFPRLVHAQRCCDFIRGGRALAWTDERLGVATFPAAAHAEARQFWRFCGECVSTRQAADALGLHPASVTAMQGHAANETIRHRLADLAGQQPEDVFLFPSGMAANFAVHRMLTSLFPARKTAQLDFPYVDVLKLQQRFGSGADFFPLTDDAGYGELHAAMKLTSYAGLFCEAPSNPLLRCVDFERLLEIREETQPDTPIIVDDTISTVAHADAHRVADLVTTSLTKSFSGAGDVLAGSVILNHRSPHHAAFTAFLRENADHELWRGDAVALELNSRDFSTRADVMSRNAEALAEFLSQHPRVDRVWHAKSQAGRGYESIRREQGGYGCLLSFTVKNPETASEKVYDALRVTKGPSLGTDFTLACPYTLLAHYDELPWVESLGVSRWLLRVSTGLEPTSDLLARFEEAL
jgi:cystathionine gamma-synthase